MSKEKPLEITEEDKAQAEIEMKEKRVISLKIVKRFAHLIDSLPEDFLLETDVVNFLLKPLVEELYEGCIEDGACLNDIKAAGDLMGMFVSMSLGRCTNQTKTMLSELYKETLGEYNPEEEMKIGAIATRLQAIQLAK